MFHSSVGGVKVSIVAFQAIDPGSIPGWRTFLTLMCQSQTYSGQKHLYALMSESETTSEEAGKRGARWEEVIFALGFFEFLARMILLDLPYLCRLCMYRNYSNLTRIGKNVCN